MWGLQKYQNHYEIPFGRGCIDLKNLAVLLLLAQGKSDTLSLFEDFNMARYFKNIFLIWINVNRLCWHVGLEFWTINSFICPKSTSLTTWQFRFTTLYILLLKIFITEVKSGPWIMRLINSDHRSLGWFKSGTSYKTSIFTLLRPDSESFGKWCLENCNFFFHFEHSNACLKRPKVLVHITPMWNGVKREICLFSIFSL